MKKLLISLFIIMGTAKIFAQGGGPPMITDDPGTPDKNSWEINLSFVSEIRKLEREFGLPQLDINYGYNERTQLKVEIVHLRIKEEYIPVQSQFGNLKLGIKYRFLDEGSSPLSLSMYPQLGIDMSGNKYNSYIIPVQLEKSLGKWVLGADLGYVYIKDNFDYFFNGLIMGYGFSEHFEMMTELNYVVPREHPDDIIATLNLGMRLNLSNNFVFISSIGKGIVSPSSEQGSQFISFLGLQMIF